jgi:hypothetical protein
VVAVPEEVPAPVVKKGPPKPKVKRKPKPDAGAGSEGDAPAAEPEAPTADETPPG